MCINTYIHKTTYGLRQPAPAAQLASEPAAPAAEALKQQVLRGFKDTAFAFVSSPVFHMARDESS